MHGGNLGRCITLRSPRMLATNTLLCSSSYQAICMCSDLLEPNLVSLAGQSLEIHFPHSNLQLSEGPYISLQYLHNYPCNL